MQCSSESSSPKMISKSIGVFFNRINLLPLKDAFRDFVPSIPETSWSSRRTTDLQTDTTMDWCFAFNDNYQFDARHRVGESLIHEGSRDQCRLWRCPWSARWSENSKFWDWWQVSRCEQAERGPESLPSRRSIDNILTRSSGTNLMFLSVVRRKIWT
jgi:hypothetical protein